MPEPQPTILVDSREQMPLPVVSDLVQQGCLDVIYIELVTTFGAEKADVLMTNLRRRLRNIVQEEAAKAGIKLDEALRS